MSTSFMYQLQDPVGVVGVVGALRLNVCTNRKFKTKELAITNFWLILDLIKRATNVKEI